jgi:hypothetical protein
MDSHKGRSSETSSVFPDENPVNTQIKILQMTRVAMILSPVIFLVVALGINQGDLNLKIDFMEILGLGMAGSALSSYFLIDKFYCIKTLDTIRSLPAEEMNFSLAKELVSLEIIKIALLEGATFFGFILIIIDNSLVGLILGVVLILVSIATFPTSTRFLQRLESLRFRVGL